MEFVGVLVRGLIRCHSLWPGTAPSRLKAYSIREFAVTEAIPQKACATTAISNRSSAPTRERAFVQIVTGAESWAETAEYVAAFVGMTDVMARMRTQPAMSEITIEPTMPRGAARLALCVSSGM